MPLTTAITMTLTTTTINATIMTTMKMTKMTKTKTIGTSRLQNQSKRDGRVLRKIQMGVASQGFNGERKGCCKGLEGAARGRKELQGI